MTLNRILTKSQVAAKLGWSVAWFNQHRTELERQGFPRPRVVAADKKTSAELWAERAVDAWVNMADETSEDIPATTEQQYWGDELARRLTGHSIFGGLS